MNSKQLQYAVELSRVLNISQTAEKLNITQPALSKQILTLEKELGITLFDRSTTPLKLTRAGELFISEATEILFKEERLKHLMQDFKTGDKGRLTIGISPFRASFFIADVIKKLQQEYSGLQVVLKEEKSGELQKLATDGLVDFAIINLPVDEAMLDVIELEPEPIVLALKRSFLGLIKGYKNRKEIDLKDCKDIPFIALSKNQELRKLFDKLCITCDFSPNITAEVVGITTAWNFAKEGIGAAVLPLRFVEDNQSKEDMVILPLKNTATVRKPAIVMRKGQHLSKYAKSAIQIITEK